MISQSVGEYIFPPLANIVESYANDVYILTQVTANQTIRNTVRSLVYGSYEALINEIDNILDIYNPLSENYLAYTNLKEELMRDAGITSSNMVK